jgi:PHP family Zn ribbon phosphoesterase
VFDLPEVTYKSLTNAIKTREGFLKTYEFYPEEGKYHYDGHRKCSICWSPWESKKHGDMCTVCRKKITVGVLHRVAELADRKPGSKPENAVPFQYIVPLKTVISKTILKGENTIAVKKEYDRLIQYFGNEFAVFEASEEQVRLAAEPAIADSIMKVNSGNVQWVPGHDGVFGELILDPKQAPKGATDRKQMSLEDF